MLSCHIPNTHHPVHVPGYVCVHPRLIVVLLLLQNLVGLIPLALLLGEVTEDLALRLGETIGGLLNATFGEAHTPWLLPRSSFHWARPQERPQEG